MSLQDAPAPASPVAPAPAPRGPYRLFGLIVSSIVIVIATIVLSVIFLGLAYAVWRGLAGREAIADVMSDFGRYEFEALKNAQPATQIALFAMLALTFPALLIPVLIAARIRGGRHWREIVAWTKPAGWPRGKGLALLIVLTPLYLLALSYAIRAFVPDFKVWFFVPRSASGAILSFLVAVILAPLAEELFFRGWIQTSLRARFGAGVAVGVTAVLFALAHMDPSRLYPLAIFVPGLMLGLIREYNGSTKASFLAHAAYNGIAWLTALVWGFD